MHTTVYDTLSTDAKYRLSGAITNDDSLFELKSLIPTEWDYSLPTLTADHGTSYKLDTSLTAFKRKFYTALPLMHGIDMNNLLVAGGAPSNVLLNTHVVDVDFFLYGIDSDQAIPRISTLMNELYASYREHLIDKHKIQQQKDRQNKHQNAKSIFSTVETLEDAYEPRIFVRAIRNKNAITLIYNHEYRVQIILRLYKNKSEVLHGFDLGSSAIGFDGTNLYFTSLGKFAYEYLCNIIDPSRRSTTYEVRLQKYFSRRFDIIFPNLNMSLMRRDNIRHKYSDVCDLPFFTFSYSELTGNKIAYKSFIDQSNAVTSDYQIEDLDEHNTFYINLRNLIQGKQDYYFIHEAERCTGVDIMTALPTMSRRRVINYYDTLKKRVLESKGGLSINLARRYISNHADFGALMTNTVNFEQVLADFIEKEKKKVLKLVSGIANATFLLTFRTENPGSQLTSSFNPIFESPDKWYGTFYIDKVPLVDDSDSDE